MATTTGQASGKRARSKFDGVLPTSVRRRKAVRKHELNHDMGQANMMFALGDLDGAMAAVHEVMTKAPCKLHVERATSTTITCRLRRAQTTALPFVSPRTYSVSEASVLTPLMLCASRLMLMTAMWRHTASWQFFSGVRP